MHKQSYTTSSGDMWDSIALETMGSEVYADELMNANLKHRDLYVFPSDIVLTIPVKAEKPLEGLPPWKRGGVKYGG